MKLALVFSGQPRSYKEAYPYIKKNILDLHEVDVFWHTWRTPPGPDQKDELFTLYQPKRHVDGTPNLFKDKTLNERYPMIGDNLHPPCNTVNMFYSMYVANFLRIMHERTENVNYDWVVRCRFDFALNLPLDFLDQLDPNILYTPYEAHLEPRDMIQDQFAFGSPAIMNTYAEVFLGLDLVVKYPLFPKGGSGEDVLTTWLDMVIPDMERKYVDVKHPFPPGAYNGTPHSLIRDDFRKWNLIR